MPQEKPDFAWLHHVAFNTYSQTGEDGVLQAIFAVIGQGKQWCFECGASDGLFFSNTRRLLDQGWRGLLIDADAESFARLQTNSAAFGDRVSCIFAKINDENRLESFLEQAGAPTDLDLAVIDVDGQDYYLLNSLLRYQPRVVLVEYDPNADPDFIPTLGGQGQAGWRAIFKLACGKLYTPVFQSKWNIVLVKRPFDRLLSGSKEQMLKTA